MSGLRKRTRRFAGTGRKATGGMRRTSIIPIVVVLAALALLVPTVPRLEQYCLATGRAWISQVAAVHADVLHTDAEQSLRDRALPTKLSFAHLSVADGLSHADVRAIAQDKQGFMWFGTWLGGVDRYDGYTFKVYRHDDQDERSLACDTIWAIYVDRSGVLWVGTQEGLDRYDRDTDSFVHYRYRADDASSLPSYQARSLIEDESGILWIATSGGLTRFDRTSGRFFTYRHNPDDPTIFGDTDIRSVSLDATTGMLWVTSWHKGVSVLDRSTGHFTRYTNNPDDPTSLSNNDLVHIYQDRKGNLWFSTLRGLNRFDPRTHTFIRYLHDPGNSVSLSDDNVTMTYEDRAGRFWVATNNGLNLMDRDHGTFTRYLHDPNDSSSLSSNVINWGALYEDASGALWLGMRSTGVDRLAGGAARFTTYRHVSQDPESPSNNVITALAMGPGGALWIGTEAGLDRFDGQRFTHHVADPSDPGSLSPGPEREVALDSHGAVWTGTYGGGLDRLDGQHVMHFRHDPRNSDSPASNNISSLVPDAHGGLWIGVHGDGLDYFDGRHFTHFPPDPANPTGLRDGWVLPLLLDPRGMLWLATSNWGLVRFDTHTQKFTTYLMDPNHPGNPVVNWTQDVYSDGAGIWVASPTTGLFRFDLETGKFTHHYTEKDGLPNKAVLGVLGDNQGNVWVSTVKGLSRFDPRTETFRNYDMFDGLQGNEFSWHCHAKAPDGRLFFGGTDGLSAFYPDKLAYNPTPPPVVLTEFDLFNKPVKIGAKDSPLRQAIHAASSIILRYDQSVFRFQFAALDFTAPQKNRYAYKLDNFDRDWQYTDATRRFATYTHLDPGDYTFRVKASNNDGVWNEQGVSLHIRILPPWWNTWWFRALSAAALFALLWGLYQNRVRELRREEQKFREAVETMPALAFVAEPGGNHTFFNRGWLEYTGVHSEETSGSGWEKAIHPDDLMRVLDRWRMSETSGQPLEYEARLRCGSNGDYRWFQTRARPLRDKRGKIVKWCAVATDIEDRKHAEQLQLDLAHVNRISTLGELAASISHELKQPITAAMVTAAAGLRWLKRDKPNVDKVSDALGNILDSGKRATEIIDRLRALYKKAPPQREPLAVNTIISEIVVLLRAEANRYAVSMRTDLTDNLPSVIVDRVQIQQVLMNLMLNGIEAMSETGGVLSVKSKLRADGQIQISVNDTGSGLPQDNNDHIFDAFFTTKPQGSGMGLAICKSIVESHGGRIWASGNDGRGAIFHFALPVAPSEANLSPDVA
jgi:PAS domain S-box-containing protein